MATRLLLFIAFLLLMKTTAAQERSFSFGVGPAFTYGFTKQADKPESRGYSSRFSYLKTSKDGIIKGVSIDLTEVSTMDTFTMIENNRPNTYRIRHFYGHPAITIAADLGREIKKGGSSFCYYGSAGPVFGFHRTVVLD